MYPVFTEDPPATTMQMFPVSLHLQQPFAWLKAVPTTNLCNRASLLRSQTATDLQRVGTCPGSDLSRGWCPSAAGLVLHLQGGELSSKAGASLAALRRDTSPPGEGWGCAECGRPCAGRGALQVGRKIPRVSRMGGRDRIYRPPLLSLRPFLVCPTARCSPRLEPLELSVAMSSG